MNQETKIENTEVGWEETVVMICSQSVSRISSENKVGIKN
jgi:hypothetical protein